MGLPPVGVQLVAENAGSFSGALDKAKSDVLGFAAAAAAAGQQIGGTAGGFNQAGMAAGGLGGIFNNLNIGSGALAIAMGNLAAQGIARVASGFQNLIKTGKDFVSQSIVEAGRFEEMIGVARMMGATQGLAAADVDKLVASIRAQGIEAGKATDLVTQFAQAGLDMTKTLELAKVAQDAAVISNSNSSDTLDRLRYGIMTYNTEVLRSAGITIIGDQAMKTYAESVKKTTEQLTPAERQQAMYNAVLKEGEKIAGAYATAMQSGYKVAQSMRRVINDLQVALGMPFQNAYYQVEKAQYEMWRGMRMIVDEGGALHPLLEKLGAVAAVVTERARNFAMSLLGAVDAEGKLKDNSGPLSQWLINLGNNFETFAQNALSWGANIVANLASGIIQGASTVLVTAMNFISSILSGWLEPGSPPAVAPDIDKWGTEALAQWLHGFTKGDFSSLTALQAPLRQALDAAMGPEAKKSGLTGQTFAGFSGELTQALAGGGLATDFYSRLRAATGDYGDEIVKLVQQQLALNSANEAVLASEKALEAIRKSAQDSLKKVDDLVAEYNQMARSGASQEQLKAKRDEILAAQEAYKAKVKEYDAAAEKLDQDKAALTPMQEQYELQKALVDQLLQLAAAQKEAATAGGGAKAPEFKVPATIAPTLTKTVEEAFAQLKEKVGAALDDALKPFTEKFGPGSEVSWALFNLRTAWNDLTIVMTNFYYRAIKPWLDPLIEKLNKATDNNFLGWLAELAGKAIVFVPLGLLILNIFAGLVHIFAIIAPILGAIVGGIATLIGTIGFLPIALVAVFALLAYVIYKNWDAIQAWVLQAVADITAWWARLTSDPIEYFRQAWEDIKEWAIQAWGDIWAFFVGIYNYLIGHSLIPDLVNGIIGWFQTLWDTLVTKWEEFKTNLTTAWEGLKTWATTLWEDIKTTVTTKWNELWTAAGTAWENFKTNIGTSWNTFIEEVKKWWDGLLSHWSTEVFIQQFKDIGNKLVQGIKDGLSDAWELLVENVEEKVGALPQWIKDLFGIHSPSKVMYQIGKQIVAGITQGMANTIPSMYATMYRAMNQLEGLVEATNPRLSLAVSPASGGRSALGGAGNSYQSAVNYNLQVYTSQSPQVVTNSFKIMEVLAA